MPRVWPPPPPKTRRTAQHDITLVVRHVGDGHHRSILTYGTEAMIPVEVGEPSIRRQLFNVSLNKERLAVGLDLLNELRDKSKIREAACKLRASRRYNSKVQPRSFQQGDLVWRMRSNARKSDGKFSSNWEGPFRIREVGEGGAYHLEHLSGKIVPRTWNATHLKFYFS